MVIYGVTLSVNVHDLVLSHLYFTDRLDASAIANCQDGCSCRYGCLPKSDVLEWVVGQ